MYNENALLNKHKSELEVKVEQLSREISEANEKLGFLRSERTENLAVIDDLQRDLGM